MRSVLVMVLVAALPACTCSETHVRDGGVPDSNSSLDAASWVDAPPCTRGQPCDCRAARVLPAGTHWVGSDVVEQHAFAHRVTLTRDVWLGRFEASAGCYDRCIREGSCTRPDPDPVSDASYAAMLPSSYWSRAEHADLPIIWISPDQARSYCAWLGGRLPTSAEHEKAARGEDGRPVPWAPAPTDPRRPPLMRREDLREHAHDPFELVITGVVAIDSRADGVGPYGHEQVIGNALEWVADGFEGFPSYPADDVTDPLLGSDSPNRLARSLLGEGWERIDADHLDWATRPPGVRCAFDAEPEMLAR